MLADGRKSEISAFGCFPVHNNFLAAALKGINVGTWRFDTVNDRLDWDEVTGSLLGMTAVDGLPFSGIPLHPDDVSIIQQSVANCLATGQAHDAECRMVLPGGAIRWVHVFGRLLESDVAQTGCISGIITDITGRKKAELKVAESQRQLQTIIDNLPGIIYRCGTQPPWTMDFISHAVKEVTGYDASEFLDQTISWDEIIAPEDRAVVAAKVAEALEQRGQFDIRYRIITASGALRWVHERGSASYGEDGAALFLEGFVGDLSEVAQAEARVRETEERYRLASLATRDLVWDWELASDRINWNEALSTNLGYKRRTLGTTRSWWHRQVHPEDRERIGRALEATLSGTGDHFQAEYRFRRSDGEYASIYDRGYLIRDGQGRPVRMVGAMQDLTSDRQASAALSESKAINRSILAASADCIKIITLDGRIELFNEPGIQAMELPSAAAVLGCVWADLWPEESRYLVHKALADAASGGPSRFTGFCPTYSGAPKWWDVVVTPMQQDGKITRLLAISRDVTAIRNTTQQLQWSSEHDSLTGLPNRRAFEMKLQAGTLNAMATGGNLGLLLIDLDHFKHVNDTLGHQAGDFLLMNFAERLAASVRESDFVARLGGDEFAVILHHVRGEADLLRAGASILARIQAPILYEGRSLSARASIGGAVYPRDAGSANELFKNADTALFALKAEGRGGTRMFHTSMCDQMHSVASQISLARAAIQSDVIRPYYQPKVCLQSGDIVGFEALLRVEQPGGTPQPPASIAEAFKEYELASTLGDRMQGAVLGDVAGWVSQGLPFGRVSINAAPAEFLRDDYAERLLAMLARFGVSPEHIEVEVTEQVFMERGGAYVTRALRELHRQGIRISLDDFGTGYSSLSHLRDYPVDVVKIDRSFVEQVTIRPDMAAIVRAIANLCSSLGLQVVAEGIETPEQAARLVAKGCGIGQGYLFGRPVPASKVSSLFEYGLFDAWPPVLALT